MKTNKMSLEEFALSEDPSLAGRYKLYCMTDEELIEKDCVSIVSGFSGGPGTKCYISEIIPSRRDLEKDIRSHDRIIFRDRNDKERVWEIRRSELLSHVALVE